MINCIICSNDRNEIQSCKILHQTHHMTTGRLIAVCCKCYHIHDDIKIIKT